VSAACDETALARGWGLISARAVPKMRPLERRITAGYDGAVDWTSPNLSC